MRLDDFYHLPALADGLARLVADRPGLTLVAGPDLPASAATAEALHSSGRGTIFRVLAEMLLADDGGRAAVVAADAEAFRVPRAYRQQVTALRVQRRQPYAAQIARAQAHGARLLVIDQLAPENAGHVMAAVGSGVRVITQLNSAAHGVALAREIEGLGVAEGQLPGRLWLVAVRRLAMLCPACRQPQPLTALQRLQLRHRPAAGLDPDGRYQAAAGCAHCERRGRRGTVALFDLCRLWRDGGRLDVEAVLPRERYARALAEGGALAFDDVIDLDGLLTRQIFQQVTANQQDLADASQAMERKLAELHSANEVLQQRTSALLSFQAVGQALISSTDLRDLAGRVCRHVGDLCGADRTALYIMGAGGGAQILAVGGWDGAYVGRQVDGAALATRASEPSPYAGWPPGIPPLHADVLGGELLAGLCAPLIAEREQVGMLIIHTMSRGRFTPGETALLQTFAHQAALLIQRTRLIDDLNAHIVRLGAAQAALVEQERLAREMELAADVQRSILPRVYPRAPGLTFAADNRPAREVGGDFYDVFALDEASIGVVIADVSGKGMPAALYMALTRSLLLAEARRARSPRAVLLDVNRLLREVGDPQMFVTVFYGIIDIPSRRLTYARAGHDYPLLFRGDAVEPLVGAGLVLGMFDDEVEQLTEQQIDLAEGDRLVLYTDGMIDALDEGGRRLELPGLTAILRRHRRESPGAICSAAFAALGTYQGAAEQFDDMTLVVVGVEAPAGEGRRGRSAP